MKKKHWRFNDAAVVTKKGFYYGTVVLVRRQVYGGFEVVASLDTSLKLAFNAEDLCPSEDFDKGDEA